MLLAALNKSPGALNDRPRPSDRAAGAGTAHDPVCHSPLRQREEGVGPTHHEHQTLQRQGRDHRQSLEQRQGQGGDVKARWGLGLAAALESQRHGNAKGSGNGTEGTLGEGEQALEHAQMQQRTGLGPHPSMDPQHQEHQQQQNGQQRQQARPRPLQCPRPVPLTRPSSVRTLPTSSTFATFEGVATSLLPSPSLHASPSLHPCTSLPTRRAPPVSPAGTGPGLPSPAHSCEWVVPCAAGQASPRPDCSSPGMSPVPSPSTSSSTRITLSTGSGESSATTCSGARTSCGCAACSSKCPKEGGPGALGSALGKDGQRRSLVAPYGRRPSPSPSPAPPLDEPSAPYQTPVPCPQQCLPPLLRNEGCGVPEARLLENASPVAPAQQAGPHTPSACPKHQYPPQCPPQSYPPAHAQPARTRASGPSSTGSSPHECTSPLRSALLLRASSNPSAMQDACSPRPYASSPPSVLEGIRMDMDNCTHSTQKNLRSLLSSRPRACGRSSPLQPMAVGHLPSLQASSPGYYQAQRSSSSVHTLVPSSPSSTSSISPPTSPALHGRYSTICPGFKSGLGSVSVSGSGSGSGSVISSLQEEEAEEEAGCQIRKSPACSSRAESLHSDCSGRALAELLQGSAKRPQAMRTAAGAAARRGPLGAASLLHGGLISVMAAAAAAGAGDRAGEDSCLHLRCQADADSSEADAAELEGTSDDATPSSASIEEEPLSYANWDGVEQLCAEMEFKGHQVEGLEIHSLDVHALALSTSLRDAPTAVVEDTMGPVDGDASEDVEAEEPQVVAYRLWFRGHVQPFCPGDAWARQICEWS